MLDTLGILFSSIIMFLVILRSVRLNSTQPWFRPPGGGPNSSGLRLKPPAADETQPRRRQATR